MGNAVRSASSSARTGTETVDQQPHEQLPNELGELFDETLVVLAPAGHIEPGLLALNNSCNFHGITLRWVAFDDMSSKSGGRVWSHSAIMGKFPAILGAVQGLEPSTVVLVVDAFDCLVQASARRIISSYRQQRHPILFGYEKICWRRSRNAHRVNRSTVTCTLPAMQEAIAPGKFLNSGLMLARAGLLADFLTRRLQDQWPGPSQGLHPKYVADQPIWQHWYLRYYPFIGLDLDSHVLMNVMARIDRRTGSQPVEVRRTHDGGGLYLCAPAMKVKNRAQHPSSTSRCAIPTAVHFNGFSKRSSFWKDRLLPHWVNATQAHTGPQPARRASVAVDRQV